MATEGLSFGGTLIVAAIGGLAATVINHGLVMLTKTRADSREARYLAQRLIVILERFAIDCSELIAMNSLYWQSKGILGSISAALPELTAYPSDADWKSIDTLLAGRVLSLPNEIVLAGRSVEFSEDANGAEGGAHEAARQAGKCGYRAWELAVSLGGRHKLPLSDLTQHTWDFVDTLKGKHDAVMAEREKYGKLTDE